MTTLTFERRIARFPSVFNSFTGSSEERADILISVKSQTQSMSADFSRSDNDFEVNLIEL